MPIRTARYNDLKSIAEVLGAAFHDEGLNAYFFPHRGEYPEDYMRAWYQAVLTKWWDCDSTWLVSYDDTKDDESTSGRDDGTGESKRTTSKITGAAQWGRTIAEPGALQKLSKFLDPSKYCKSSTSHEWSEICCESDLASNTCQLGRYVAPLISSYFTFHRWCYPNRAVGKPSTEDLQPIRKWDFGQIIIPFCKSLYEQPSARNGHWELEILGVHPGRQKCGYAAELIGWGIQRAKGEKLPAVVIMAEGLEKFYARHGFEVLVGYVPDEDMVVQEKDSDGKVVERRIVNPLKQRRVGGGAVAWTRIEVDPS